MDAISAPDLMLIRGSAHRCRGEIHIIPSSTSPNAAQHHSLIRLTMTDEEDEAIPYAVQQLLSGLTAAVGRLSATFLIVPQEFCDDGLLKARLIELRD